MLSPPGWWRWMLQSEPQWQIQLLQSVELLSPKKWCEARCHKKAFWKMYSYVHTFHIAVSNLYWAISKITHCLLIVDSLSGEAMLLRIRSNLCKPLYFDLTFGMRIRIWSNIWQFWFCQTWLSFLWQPFILISQLEWESNLESELDPTSGNSDYVKPGCLSCSKPCWTLSSLHQSPEISLFTGSIHFCWFATIHI